MEMEVLVYISAHPQITLGNEDNIPFRLGADYGIYVNKFIFVDGYLLNGSNKLTAHRTRDRIQH